jgi:hypothetical protein
VHRIGQLDVLEMVVLQSLFVVKMNIPTGKTFKTYKSRCKTVSDHQYHWHSGSPELPAGSQKKNSNRSGGAHKSRKSEVSKQK